MKKIYPALRLLIVLLLSVKAVWPLFSSGYFPMHDNVQPARVIAMSRALAEGQFPVRWVADLGYGYGYPLFNFYGPLPYYVGGIAHLFTGDALFATKFMMGAGMVLAAVSMYMLASLWLPFAGVLAVALLYMYAPYHGVQLFVRGAVGELWAYGLLPLVAAGIVGTFRKKKHSFLLGAVGLAGVITAHTIMGYLTVGLTAVSVIVAGLASKKFPTRLFAMLAAGLGLSAFFWLPAVAEMGFTNVAGQVGGGADFRDHFVCLSQLWQSPFGYGGSAQGCIDGFSFKLGKLHVVLGLVGIAFLVKGRRVLKPGDRAIGMGGTLLALGAVFFMTPLSSRLWEALPYAGYIQYPWRLLTFALLGLALLSGFIWKKLSGRLAVAAAFLTLILTLIINAEAFVPQYMYAAQSSDFENTADLRLRASGISDEYLPADFVRPSGEEELPRDTITGTATHGTMSVSAEESRDVIVPRAYFPGWRYWVAGQEVQPQIVNGLPAVPVPAGEAVIEMRLVNTPVRTFANILSAVSVLVIGGMYAKYKKAIA